MTKKKGWQLALILTVIGLTIYNILPTVIFYTKPLNKPIDQTAAQEIIASTAKRVNTLEDDALSWVSSFNRLLGIKAKKVGLVKNNPQFIEVQFGSKNEAETFKHYLPRAGSLIPFYPSQLSLNGQSPLRKPNETEQREETSIILKRNISLHFPLEDLSGYFEYSPMFNEDGSITPKYGDILQDRIANVLFAAGGTSENSTLVQLATEKKEIEGAAEFLYILAQNILAIDTVTGSHKEIARSFYNTFSLGIQPGQKEAKISELTSKMSAFKDKVQLEKIALKEKLSKNEVNTQDVAASFSELESLEAKEQLLLKALTILRTEKSLFISENSLLTLQDAHILLVNANTRQDNSSEVSLEKYNPIIKAIEINVTDGSLSLILSDAILQLKNALESNPASKARLDTLEQMIFNEIAHIARNTEETFTQEFTSFSLNLRDLPDSKSVIVFHLEPVAAVAIKQTKQLLLNEWNPVSEDLKREAYPITDFSLYERLPESQKTLQLVVYAPSLTSTTPPAGFKQNAIYVIAKDLGKILKKYHKNPSSSESMKIRADFEELYRLLQTNGFVGYPGTMYPLSGQFADDYIFEASDFYLPLLQATRENFKVHGSKKVAVLELSDLKERILTVNHIETKMHEDLLKWRDEYNAAQVNPDLKAHFDVPKPTKNVLWNNLLLSTKKYFRGDERKILRWGLDLSGGKTVQIALKDTNNKLVTDEADIKQGMNELYNRINKMGVSDVSIRQEGNSITIDFPGSQSVSASELIKASTMTFNIVNETFATDRDRPNASLVNQFLQEVWNEAVVTNKKDVSSINQIAWAHLYGDSLTVDAAEPKTEAAKQLFTLGFRLSDPSNMDVSSEFNDVDSMISLYRGESFADWHGQSHPLLIVFKNHALEGSNLENVHAGYDPSKGNFLSFGVKSSQTLPSQKKISPRKSLYAWTEVFAKDKISGTPYEAATHGNGWRMAVILNGFVVSAPQLESALKDSGMITGHFTQREIAKLAADLKAGSLSFTPQILSEQSVTPDLGIHERHQGILATVVALVSVVVLMIGYYRFGGVVASIAVLFNLLITWATLQNMGVTITLANLAGIILAIGMAVDANVLVFERIREEFAKTHKITQAVAAGYQKAFSAILDSNITTIIAAVILLNFDSGPIKGFAVTLIIGIVSSMFTALFMTKYFFSHWVKNPAHKELKMAHLIKPRNWDFVKHGKKALFVSILLVALGGVCLALKQKTIFGMDFTGGYAVTLELEKTKEDDYRKNVERALMDAGVSMQEMQIRELSLPNKLRIFLGSSLTEAHKPFYQMPIEIQVAYPTYNYEVNPQLVWLVQTLEKANLHLTEKSKMELDQHWKNVSGQMSEAMRNNAIIGLVLALVCILIYITFRFEFTYAISATLGVLFDLLITIALLGILHFCGVSLQIDLNAVGALMTIAGYSLNDTIIVFDRIREDVKLMHRSSFKEVINHALNVTLSRTILTSGTTLVVLLALVLLGGNTIFGFSLIMSIGIIVGTLSTFFIATTLLLYFQKREKRKADDEELFNQI